MGPDDIELRLQRLVARGLAVKDGRRYLALAIPLGDYKPSRAVTQRFYALAGKLGRTTRAGIIVRLDEIPAPNEAESRGRDSRTAPRRVRGRVTPAHFALHGDEMVIRYAAPRRKDADNGKARFQEWRQVANPSEEGHRNRRQGEAGARAFQEEEHGRDHGLRLGMTDAARR